MWRLVRGCGLGSATLIAISVYVGLPTLLFLRALALIVALDVALALPGHPQRPRRDVVDDDRPRGGPGVVADLDWSHERGVDATVHPVADPRAVLAEAVVVGGDGAGADVGPLPHVGVAEVGQVGDFGPGADVGVLHLHERPHLGALADHRARAQVGERAHQGAVVDLA